MARAAWYLYFQLSPLVNLGLRLRMVVFVMMVCDYIKIIKMGPDKSWLYLIMPIFFLAFMIFSLRCSFFMNFYPGTITTHAESINSAGLEPAPLRC